MRRPDHVFIFTARGAPAATHLRQFGLTEGTPNRHPGQGTACRRFFFQNVMLELVWVEDEAEAASTAALSFLQRSSGAGGASPFGIILRPDSLSNQVCPFPAWDYCPPTMPDLALKIASGTAIDEPLWCYMQTGRPPKENPPERRQPLDHAAGFREITGVQICCPRVGDSSVTALMAAQNRIGLSPGPDHLMELDFNGLRTGNRIDFRPHLPLLCRW